jgi:uncharacterized coiled-coil DUF342 family protein
MENITINDRTKMITELAENLGEVDKDILENEKQIESLQDYRFNLRRKRQDIIDALTGVINDTDGLVIE